MAETLTTHVWAQKTSKSEFDNVLYTLARLFPVTLMFVLWTTGVSQLSRSNEYSVGHPRQVRNTQEGDL